jgi:hypothetical protein
MGTLFGETTTRKEWFESRGFTFTSIWGCEFKKMLAVSPELQEAKKTLVKFEPLQPRDAFYGGRTEHFRTFWVAETDECMSYVDFTSLYPFVNATQEYPEGHPTKILTSDAYNAIDLDAVNSLWGLFKCRVLPPRTLLIPILPLRGSGKLMFPLCSTCCNEGATEYCTHTEVERSFWGTFCSPELRLAIQYGYTVLEIGEVWHWEHRSTTLFKSYIQTFLKAKTEASGWPEGCEDDELLQARYVADYQEREGVLLEPDNISQNEGGLRFISKLLLNSFWGYLGMKNNLPQVEYTKTYSRLFEMMNSKTLTVEDACLVGEELAMLQYTDNDDFVRASTKTNVVLAAFTTAHARCLLYKVSSYNYEVKHTLFLNE